LTGRSDDDTDDGKFQTYLKLHPSATRAQFHMEEVAQQLSRGAIHHSLGTNLKGGHDFWEAGAAKAARYLRESGIKPAARVIDYGCGSLRIGAHFIRFLDSGNFVGLDVTQDFYKIGKTEIGTHLLQAKMPRFGVIAEDEIARSEAFGADLVYSNAVCYQVHPEERGTYFSNLSRLAHKPGAQVMFNCMLADEPVRYGHRSWAWPLESYKEALNGLGFVGAKYSRQIAKGAHSVCPAVLQFRRVGGNGARGFVARVRSLVSR
jgi:SAM-dependent methyltransferase